MNYPSPIAALITDDAFARYTQSQSGTEEVLALLQALDVKDILGEEANSDGQPERFEMAHACISGLWLLHNFLHESHEISQAIDSPVGSFWHAIMHRMEGDFSNSKYWYRRVGKSSLYAEVGQRSGEPFDPSAFVDQVQSQGSEATRSVAVAEWQVLFEHCFREATF